MNQHRLIIHNKLMDLLMIMELIIINLIMSKLNLMELISLLILSNIQEI